jgi:hypothetical protein
MPDYRSYFDSEVIRYVDLDGKDYDLKIIKVDRDKVVGKNGKASSKVFIRFEGRDKPFAACKEACAPIAALYGLDTKAWVGKWITIFPDPTVKYGGQAVGGIRVRGVAPKKEAAK